MGLVVLSAILAVGGFLLRDAGDGPLTVLVLVAFVAGGLVYAFTEEHAKRRREDSQ
jgi:hypothetical protein